MNKKRENIIVQKILNTCYDCESLKEQLKNKEEIIRELAANILSEKVRKINAESMANEIYREYKAEIDKLMAEVKESRNTVTTSQYCYLED